MRRMCVSRQVIRVVAVVAPCLAIAGCAREPRARTESVTSRAGESDIAAPSSGRRPECVSLLGQSLFATRPADGGAAERQLAKARARLMERPDSVDLQIWVGRRLGYLWRMNDAIAVYSEALHKDPHNAALLRHRGHRYISIREFGKARADLARAGQLIKHQPDQVEPDGQPNARNIPLTTLAFNVHYHHALACYLLNDDAAALTSWQETLSHAGRYADNHVAAAYWMYLTLRRMGRHADAQAALQPVQPDMEIIENHAYYRLCLLYKAVLTERDVADDLRQRPADAPALLYGLGQWHAFSGNAPAALAQWRQAVKSTPWPAFGHIAAEVELARPRAAQALAAPAEAAPHTLAAASATR